MSNIKGLKKMSVAAMLTAVAYLCMFLFKFKISFLTFDFKDAFLAIISFLYGPVYGLISSISVAFFEFLSVSDTGPYGFLMNALSSGAFAVTCGLFYKYNHTFKGAISGAISAVVVMTAIMLVANWIITPLYMGIERNQVVAMIPTLLLPFNLIKGLFNMATTLILYKPITSALKKSGLISSKQNTDKKKFLILCSVSIAVVIILVLIIFLCFNGDLLFFKNKALS